MIEEVTYPTSLMVIGIIWALIWMIVNIYKHEPKTK